MKTTNVPTLKIHKLTQEQYDRELANGNIDENAIYLTPDEEIDLSPYATIEQLNGKANTSHGNHVPTTEAANNARFLRNDNTWQTITPANIGAAAASHGPHVTTATVKSALGTGSGTTKYLREDGTWQVPPDTNTQAVSSVNGKTGAVSLGASDVGAVPTGRTVNGKALSTNISLSASDVKALPISGGTLTGAVNVNGVASIDTNGYVAGTWLRMTADTSLGSTPTEGICVKQNGWIYTRTLAQILSDIGAAPIPTISATDITAGSTSLTTGKSYHVYE